jgi:hypothetical protein
MSEIPYFVRYKEVTTLDSADSLYLDDATSDVPKKISMTDFASSILDIPTDSAVYILNGGVNNQDEDVPQLIGGLNGISKNSNTINNG